MGTVTHYKIGKPPQEPFLVEFSDGSTLNVPEGTTYLGIQEFPELFTAYIRVGSKGKGAFNFKPGLLGELEKKIEPLCPEPFSPSP